jgi:hypothetical protein
MFDEARNGGRAPRVPDRNVVDAAQAFLPATPLDPRYLEWLATKSEQLPQRPPSYLDAPPHWAAYARTRPASPYQ